MKVEDEDESQLSVADLRLRGYEISQMKGSRKGREGRKGLKNFLGVLCGFRARPLFHTLVEGGVREAAAAPPSLTQKNAAGIAPGGA